MLEGNPEIQYRQALSENSICQEIKQESAYATPEMLFKKRKKKTFHTAKETTEQRESPHGVREIFSRMSRKCFSKLKSAVAGEPP